MDSAMELSKETLDKIGDYVKGNLGQWMREVGAQPIAQTDPQLLERMVRVEESLERQRELMERGFARNDERFEQVDTRFERMDQRFEEMREDFTGRFEQADQRFVELRQDFVSRFEQVDKNMDRHRSEGRRQTTILATMMSLIMLFMGYAALVA